jgi:hypothetical protein
MSIRLFAPAVSKPLPRASDKPRYRVHHFRNHRQVDDDAIAFLDVARAQDARHPAHFVVQFLVGDVPGLRGIVALPGDCCLVAALGEMTVDAVVSGVEQALLEPFDRVLPGAKEMFSILWGVLIQSTRLACSAQKPLGALTERSYITCG